MQRYCRLYYPRSQQHANLFTHRRRCNTRVTPPCSYQRLANSAALEALFFPYVFQFILYIAVLLFAILPDDSSHECAPSAAFAASACSRAIVMLR